MNQPSSDSSPADKIQAALDDMVAQRRRKCRATASAPAAVISSPAPLPVERPATARWVLIGLLAATAHAAGIYWYVQSKPATADTVLVIKPAPALSPAEQGAVKPQNPSISELSAGDRVMRTNIAGAPGIIEHDGKVIVVPTSPSRPRSTPPRHTVATTVAGPAPRLSSRAPAPAARASTSDHAKAAENFAYQHFRYKYKVGASNYAVTSLNAVVNETEEVVGWNRYRSTGEAGLEYYDNSGFRRTTRRFEVLTEEKNGEARALEITVK